MSTGLDAIAHGSAAVRTRPARRDIRDEDVLAAVTRLVLDDRSPSTSLVVLAFGEHGAAGGALQAAVRTALERLRERGALVCVARAGTHRWELAPPAAHDRERARR